MACGSWSSSRQTAKEQCGITRRINPQADAAPLDGIAFAGDQILHCRDVTALAGNAYLDIAKRKPELMRLARQRDSDRDAVGLIDRFLDEADDVAVLDWHEAQLAGLLQCCVG